MNNRHTFARSLADRAKITRHSPRWLQSVNEHQRTQTSAGLAPVCRQGATNSLTEPGISPRLASFLTDQLGKAPLERMIILFFSADGTCVGSELVKSENPARVTIWPIRLLRKAQRIQARAIVIAHNHPGGVARPSAADIRATAIFDQMASQYGLRLAEHFIVGSEGIFSMRRARLVR